MTGNPALATFSVVASRAVDEVEHLWKELHLLHSPLLAELGPTKSVDASWASRRAKYTSWLERSDGILVLAVESGRTVGYAMARVTPETSDTLKTSGKLGMLESLVVARALRGNGIGSALLEFTLARLRQRGIINVSLNVVRGNLHALAFFERFGFGVRSTGLWLNLPG